MRLLLVCSSRGGAVPARAVLSRGQYRRPVRALIAAAVLGLINALIRPLLIVLTLPATLLTLGLSIFVITGCCSGGWARPHGFHVAGFWSASSARSSTA